MWRAPRELRLLTGPRRTRGSGVAADLNRHLAIDSNRYLRLLGALASSNKPKNRPQRRPRYTPELDPGRRRPSLQGTPIGIVYYIQKWFRFGLQDWGGEGRDTLFRCRAGIFGVT